MLQEKKIAIIGSRRFKNLDIVEKFVQSLPKDTIVISGGAYGVDLMAEETAEKCGLRTIIYLPDFKTYGIPNAYFERNKKITDEACEVVAFWDNFSKGTKFVIDYAKQTGKPIRIIDENGNEIQ